MTTNDFYSFLNNDLEEAENIQLARLAEEEKAMFAVSFIFQIKDINCSSKILGIFFFFTYKCIYVFIIHQSGLEYKLTMKFCTSS